MPTSFIVHKPSLSVDTDPWKPAVCAVEERWLETYLRGKKQV